MRRFPQSIRLLRIRKGKRQTAPLQYGFRLENFKSAMKTRPAAVDYRKQIRPHSAYRLGSREAETVSMPPEPLNDAKLRAASTYNAAAEFFDAPALSFWDRIGGRTVERMALSRGASVLDACCGSGASAIPAAESVGAQGRVLGVDLAENL